VPAVAVVGPWAKDKLDALARYLDFYTKVLKNQRWRTIYVDGFAGGGRAVVRSDAKRPAGSSSLFLDEQEIDADQSGFIDGSPRVALDVANPFDRYVFIEPDRARSDELEAMKAEYGAKRHIDVLACDAAAGINWVVSRPISRSTHRGIAFLDPFGAKLDWESVQQLAESWPVRGGRQLCPEHGDPTDAAKFGRGARGLGQDIGRLFRIKGLVR
jgi:three-Cys-motif partner protein